MPKQARTLHQAMPIVASALGRKFGVRVTIGGDDAQTDGRTIQVPALPPDSQLIPVAWGYLAHEAAHVRYTDFDVYASGTAEGDPFDRAQLDTLLYLAGAGIGELVARQREALGE